MNGGIGKIVIRISVIRYSGIIVCAGGGFRPLINVIPSPVIAIPTKSGEAIPSKVAAAMNIVRDSDPDASGSE